MFENVQNKKQDHYVPGNLSEGLYGWGWQDLAYMAHKGHAPLQLLPDNIGFLLGLN